MEVSPRRQWWQCIIGCQDVRWYYAGLAALGVERKGVALAASVDYDVCV